MVEHLTHFLCERSTAFSHVLLDDKDIIPEVLAPIDSSFQDDTLVRYPIGDNIPADSFDTDDEFLLRDRIHKLSNPYDLRLSESNQFLFELLNVNNTQKKERPS